MATTEGTEGMSPPFYIQYIGFIWQDDSSIFAMNILEEIDSLGIVNTNKVIYTTFYNAFLPFVHTQM